MYNLNKFFLNVNLSVVVLNRNPPKDKNTNSSTEVSETVETNNNKNLWTLWTFPQHPIPFLRSLWPEEVLCSEWKSFLTQEEGDQRHLLSLWSYHNCLLSDWKQLWLCQLPVLRRSRRDAKNVFNKVIFISDCKIHTFLSFILSNQDLDPSPGTFLSPGRGSSSSRSYSWNQCEMRPKGGGQL